MPRVRLASAGAQRIAERDRGGALFHYCGGHPVRRSARRHPPVAGIATGQTRPAGRHRRPEVGGSGTRTGLPRRPAAAACSSATTRVIRGINRLTYPPRGASPASGYAVLQTFGAPTNRGRSHRSAQAALFYGYRHGRLFHRKTHLAHCRTSSFDRRQRTSLSPAATCWHCSRVGPGCLDGQPAGRASARRDALSRLLASQIRSASLDAVGESAGRNGRLPRGRGLLQDGSDNASGAQTERRGGAGPVRARSAVRTHRPLLTRVLVPTCLGPQSAASQSLIPPLSATLNRANRRASGRAERLTSWRVRLPGRASHPAALRPRPSRSRPGPPRPGRIRRD
jgi:hypothetical protein